MSENKGKLLLEELENQFHAIQTKILKARDDYLANHEKEYNKARSGYEKTRKRGAQARKKVAREAEKARKSGTVKAQNQLKKARAASVVLSGALAEAKNIMFTAEDKLKSAKPFDRKLSARAKTLAAFEKEWEKKQTEIAKKRTQAAKKRKSGREKASR